MERNKGGIKQYKSMGPFWKDVFSNSALCCLGNRLMIDEGNVSEICIQQPSKTSMKRDFSTSCFPTFFGSARLRGLFFKKDTTKSTRLDGGFKDLYFYRTTWGNDPI